MIKRIKIFSSKCGSFQKFTFFLRMFYWRRKMELWQPIWFFYTECLKLFAQACRSTKHNFLRKFFTSNCLLGHVKRKFDQPAEKVSTKGWKVCFNLPNWWKNTIFSGKKSFPSKFSFGHIECSFDNCVEKNSKNGRKFFFQSPRLTKNASFSKSKTFPQVVRLDSYISVLTTPQGKLH